VTAIIVFNKYFHYVMYPICYNDNNRIVEPLPHLWGGGGFLCCTDYENKVCFLVKRLICTILEYCLLSVDVMFKFKNKHSSVTLTFKKWKISVVPFINGSTDNGLFNRQRKLCTTLLRTVNSGDPLGLMQDVPWVLSRIL
jgi:hypothetical protein